MAGGVVAAIAGVIYEVLISSKAKEFVTHGNQTITKDELMKSVWPDTFVEETNLTRNIFALRKALGDNEQNRYIITVPGQGYRLAEGVRLVSEPDLRIVAASHSKVQIQVRETKRGGWIAAAVIATLVIGAGIVGSKFTAISCLPHYLATSCV